MISYSRQLRDIYACSIECRAISMVTYRCSFLETIPGYRFEELSLCVGTFIPEGFLGFAGCFHCYVIDLAVERGCLLLEEEVEFLFCQFVPRKFCTSAA